MVLRKKPSSGEVSSRKEFYTGLAVLAMALVAATVLFADRAWAQTLSVTQSDSPDPVTVGKDLTYNITVSSDGVTNVVLTDPLPDNTTFRSATSAGNTCTTPGQGDNSGTITCQLGNISGRETVQIVVRPTVAAAAAGSVTNQPTANSQPAANNQPAANSQNKLAFTAKSNPVTTQVNKNNKNNKNNKHKNNKNNKHKNNKNNNRHVNRHNHRHVNRHINGQYDNSFPRRFPPGIFNEQYEDTSGTISGSSQQYTGENTLGNGTGGASASSGPGGASSQAGGVTANADNLPPVSGPQGNVVNEVPTQGPLPNTGGLSFLAVALPAAGFLLLCVAVIYRIKGSLRENR